MMSRKRRYTKKDITSKSVRELRQIARDLNINITNCIERREIIDRLVASNLIQLVHEPSAEYR